MRPILYRKDEIIQHILTNEARYASEAVAKTWLTFCHLPNYNNIKEQSQFSKNYAFCSHGEILIGSSVSREIVEEMV